MTRRPAPDRTLRRRGFLLGATAISALRGARASATAAVAPLRTELSLGFGTSGMLTTDIAETTTFQIAVELECPASGVRVGVANNVAVAATLGGVCCCLSSADAPLVPLSGSKWQYLRFGGASGPAEVTVPGNAVASTGATNVPAILWSDWLPVPATAIGQPVLLFRVLVPPQTMAMSIVDWPTDQLTLLPNFPARVRLVNAVAGDYVTDPSQAAPLGQSSSVAPLHVFRYRAPIGGTQLVIGGDSELADWATFAQLCALALSTPAQPIAVWNVAWSGMPSATFWPVLQAAISQGQPSISLIQGWTANDGFTSAAYALYLARVKQSVAASVRVGAVPIVTTGMPRLLYGTPDLAGWERYNQLLPARLPQARVFNVDALIEDPTEPGNWIPDLTKDGWHPNFAGDQVMVTGFQPMLTEVLPWT